MIGLTPSEPPFKNILSRFLSEFLLLVRFGLVGIFATTIHIAILWILLTGLLLPALIANTLAFVCAFGFSFAGHYLWTFNVPSFPRKALCRFLIISVIAFLLNTYLLSAMLLMNWLDPVIAAIASAAIIPVVTFLASRFWGFAVR